VVPLLLPVTVMQGRSFVVVPLLAVTLLLSAAGISSAAVERRTFIFTPSDVLAAVDQFNATVLAHSASLGRAVKIRRGAVVLAGKSCPSLATDPARRVTRFRVLDGATRAALLGGKKTRVNYALGDALATLGADFWRPPAAGQTRQMTWAPEPAANGVTGFASGDESGALTFENRSDTAASFLVNLTLADAPVTGPTNLVMAVTTEMPPTRPGRRPKQTECFLIAPAYTADLQALVDLVTATPLPDGVRARLNTSLRYATSWLARGAPQRAARNVKRFAYDVARRAGKEVEIDAAEMLLTRAIMVIEALGM
jgi:hypothetical protein